MKYKKKTQKRRTQKRRTQRRRTTRRKTQKRRTPKRTARRTRQKIRKRRTQGKIHKNKYRKFKQKGGSGEGSQAVVRRAGGPLSSSGEGSKAVELRSIPELDLLNQLINLFSGYDLSEINFDLDVANSLIGSFCAHPWKKRATTLIPGFIIRLAHKKLQGAHTLYLEASEASLKAEASARSAKAKAEAGQTKAAAGGEGSSGDGENLQAVADAEFEKSKSAASVVEMRRAEVESVDEEIKRLTQEIDRGAPVVTWSGGEDRGQIEERMKLAHDIAGFLFQEIISETEKTMRLKRGTSILSELDKKNMEAKLRTDYRECYSQDLGEEDSVAASGEPSRAETGPEIDSVETPGGGGAQIAEGTPPGPGSEAGGGSAQLEEGASKWDKISRDLERMFETVNLLSVPNLNSEIQRCVLRRMIRHYLDKRFNGKDEHDMKPITLGILQELQLTRGPPTGRDPKGMLSATRGGLNNFIMNILERVSVEPDLAGFTRAIIFISLQLPGEEIRLDDEGALLTRTIWSISPPGTYEGTLGDLIYQPTLMRSPPIEGAEKTEDERVAAEKAEAERVAGEPAKISEEKRRLNRMEIYVDHVLTNKHPIAIEDACLGWVGRDWHMGTLTAREREAQVAAAGAQDPIVYMNRMKDHTMERDKAICVSILPFFSEEYNVPIGVAKVLPKYSDTQNLPQIHRGAAFALCNQFNVAMNAIGGRYPSPELGVTKEGEGDNVILTSGLITGKKNRATIMDMLGDPQQDITKILQNFETAPEIGGLQKGILTTARTTHEESRQVLFVVSHGAFMENLWKKVTGSSNSPTINNLDIVLLYNAGGMEGGRMPIRCDLFRFPSYFKLREKLNDIMGDPDNKIYIVMRHCPACHNVKGGDRFNSDITSGPLSFCLGTTPHWFICANLDPIFETCHRNGRPIVFAGSIIFRSLLTCCMVVQRYRIYNNRPAHVATVKPLPQADQTSTVDARDFEPEPEPES